MALGRRATERQQELFVPADRLPQAPGHVFYDKLNRLLAEEGFDAWVEETCRPYYADGEGRPGVPPGVYFRMLVAGYFEGIGSQRGIAWRCSDSLSLRKFLGVPLTEDSPDHSSLTKIRKRLPEEAHVRVFQWLLGLAERRGLLRGRTVGVDSTTLEANAAMKSIVRRDTGEDWREYVTGLMREEGAAAEGEQPSDEELRRFDKPRKKKVSNEDWTSETDPDARIAKMKDGTIHLAYKAEQVVDLETGLITGAEVYHADQADVHTLEDSLHAAQTNQTAAGGEHEIQDVAADKGYHSTAAVTALAEHTPYRSYIVEPQRPAGRRRNWRDAAPEERAAVEANRRRARGERGRRLQRKRSEIVERTFAHVCETGGARRTWLRGIENVRKRWLIASAAHNLGVMMRALFGIGTPRSLQAPCSSAAAAACAWFLAILAVWGRLCGRWRAMGTSGVRPAGRAARALAAPAFAFLAA